MFLSLCRPWLVLLAAATPTIGCLSVASAQSPQSPAYPSAPSPYTPAPPGPLEAGGLRPPTSAPASLGESETLKKSWSGRNEKTPGAGSKFLWFDVEGGYEYLALQAFRSNSLLDGDAAADSGSGLALGAAVGVRLIFLTLGGRLRLARFSAWDLWTLDGEVGLHMPMGALEPSFTFAAGYALLGAPSDDDLPELDGPSVDVSGINARLGVNLDYYVNPLLSFGARGTFEVLALWRGGAAQPADVPADTAALYERDGDGIGFE